MADFPHRVMVDMTSPHLLRHAFAVTAVQKRLSLQRLLGHDRLATIEIYRNLSPEKVVREFPQKW